MVKMLKGLGIIALILLVLGLVLFDIAAGLGFRWGCL